MRAQDVLPDHRNEVRIGEVVARKAGNL